MLASSVRVASWGGHKDELARSLMGQNIPILVYLQTAENIIDKWYRMYYKEGNGNNKKR